MGRRRRIGAAFGSIRTRLAVFFFLITVIAVAIVYVYAAPSLQSKLETQQLTTVQKLVRTSATVAKTLVGYEELEGDYRQGPTAPTVTRGETPAARRRAAHLYQLEKTADQGYLNDEEKKSSNAGSDLLARTGTNAVYLWLFNRSANGGLAPPQAAVYPSGTPSNDTQLIDAAEQAIADGKPYPKVYGDGLGVVAVPVPNTLYAYDYVTYFSNVAGDVVLVRERILEAAAIALAVVLLIGSLVAHALTVRVLRLERAAQRVAAGDLTAQFEVDSNDELGQLAAALAHMQSQLAQLEQARRRFIATASHELRTPIFSLGGFLELIQDEDLDEETRRAFVGQVREQVERLGKLATGLLDLSRLEAGSVVLEPTPTDLGVLSRAVAGEFVPALAAHDSRLELSLPDAPLRALVDAERVAQLLRILIDNAITHTPPGTAVTVAVASGEGNVSLGVSDRGPGIRDEVVERIFEPFYTADGTRGAGLGLAIARELAERLGGTLDVSSGSDGTTFTLRLPGEG